MAHLLLVEDNTELAQTVKEWLEKDHHVVDIAGDGLIGAELIDQYHFDLIVLDWNLPQLSGVDLCKQIRDRGISTPVLMLTGKGQLQDKLLGFDAGADDYLTKPFLTPELLARVRALLKRQNTFVGNVLKVGDLSLDTTRRVVMRAESETILQRQEFSVLQYLMRRPDQVISMETLMNGAWESDAEVSIDAIYACVARLRKKLKLLGSDALSTVSGQGYIVKSDS